MRLPLALVGLLVASPAWALDYCDQAPEDPEVRVCAYNPQQRYVVQQVVGFPVNLRFGPDERIKRIDFAYTGQAKDGSPSQTWRGPAAKGQDGAALAADRFQNNLPIWPFQAGHSALVVVTVTPDGAERAYAFDLTGLSGCDGCTGITSVLGFVYPQDKAEAENRAAAARQRTAVANVQARQSRQKEADAEARLKADPCAAGANFAYVAKAEEKYHNLAPTRVCDNGWLTAMAWPANVQPPSVFIIDPATHEERSAAVSPQGDGIVIGTTAEHFRLRLGHDAVMDVLNLAWKADRPADPHTGTTAPNVVRDVIGAK